MINIFKLAGTLHLLRRRKTSSSIDVVVGNGEPWSKFVCVCSRASYNSRNAPLIRLLLLFECLAVKREYKTVFVAFSFSFSVGSNFNLLSFASLGWLYWKVLCDGLQFLVNNVWESFKEFHNFSWLWGPFSVITHSFQTGKAVNYCFSWLRWMVENRG